jgi:hypothetical protein
VILILTETNQSRLVISKQLGLFWRQNSLALVEAKILVEAWLLPPQDCSG